MTKKSRWSKESDTSLNNDTDITEIKELHEKILYNQIKKPTERKDEAFKIEGILNTKLSKIKEFKELISKNNRLSTQKTKIESASPIINSFPAKQSHSNIEDFTPDSKKLISSSVSQELKVKSSKFLFESKTLNAFRNLILEKDTLLNLNSINKGKNESEVEIDNEQEWWDKRIIHEKSNLIREEMITGYIEHPVHQEPLVKPLSPQPLMLTPREVKKIRTQHRYQIEKEKQELIKQGLLEPPKAKVKLSNLMRVLGSTSNRDPTQVETEVRKQMKERQQAHNDRNLARKLTPFELKEKHERKLFDNSPVTHVMLYRIKSIKHPQNRYKIEINAVENRLTGVCLITDRTTLIIVEGCCKSQSRFHKLMTKRINWRLLKDEPLDMGDENYNLNCDLVWCGTVKEPCFERFKTHKNISETDAKKLLTDHHVEHYWKLASLN
jgi:U4/U6 small nuclear ribonucleoprotein PRP3